MISLKLISRQKEKEKEKRSYLVRGCGFRLGIVGFRITESMEYIHMVHMSFHLPSASPLLFRSVPSEQAAASHAVPMTELRLFYSEKAYKQNG